MKRFLSSFSRITFRVTFLAIALLAALIFRHLSDLMNLNALRPRITDLLQKSFHCQVVLGTVDAELIPSPGVIVHNVVFLSPVSPHRVLTSVAGVHLWISQSGLLHHRLQIRAVRFWKARFIVHHLQIPNGEAQWEMLPIPHSDTGNDESGIDRWEVRDGTLEFWDHSQTRTVKWKIDRLNGQILPPSQTAALAGHVEVFGNDSLLDLHYDATQKYPIRAKFNQVDITAAQALGISIPFIHIPSAAITIQARLTPSLTIQAALRPSADSGDIQIHARKTTSGSWVWSADGKNTVLPNTDFRLPEWTAGGDTQNTFVKAQATTAGGGTAGVFWKKPADHETALLTVEASSVTIREVLELFNLQSPSGNVTSHPSAFNPYGYESWVIRSGSMASMLRPEATFEILDSTIDVNGMLVQMTGAFDLQGTTRRAKIRGTAANIPLQSVLESFFAPPAAITGTGQMDFDLQFPLTKAWSNDLSGLMNVQIVSGVIRRLKTVYRIISVLNLENYLRLRLPEVTAQGIPFNTLTGHVVAQVGVFSSEDLFLKSDSLNIGAKGNVNIPQKNLHLILRLEMFRFVEDILKQVPITHWIFKKPNKILFPLVVTLEGPWDDVDVR